MPAPDDHVRFPSGATLRVVARDAPAGSADYDPNRSGNPLLDTSGAERQKRLARNFKVAELAQSGGNAFARARIDPKLVACLQALRDALDRPVIVLSGYRPYLYNVDLYRSRGQRPTRSQHSSGRAADVRVAGLSGIELARAAIDACGCDVAVGVAADYAHVDVRGAFARWSYAADDGAQARDVAAVDAHHARRCR